MNVLKDFRQRHRLTQFQLAAILGCTQCHLSKCESGIYGLTPRIKRHLELIDLVAQTNPHIIGVLLAKANNADG
jgi:transcriptional regulator with XRE-family HTH domain